MEKTLFDIGEERAFDFLISLKDIEMESEEKILLLAGLATTLFFNYLKNLDKDDIRRVMHLMEISVNEPKESLNNRSFKKWE